MVKCKYQDYDYICGLEAIDANGLCILHSDDPEKDQGEFDVALAKHRKENGARFSHVVFPAYRYFSREKFSQRADFSGARFLFRADFSGAEFTEGADFSNVEFRGGACFNRARFVKWVTFSGSQFPQGIDCVESEFLEEAVFKHAQFNDTANFLGARFYGEAIFYLSIFRDMAEFHSAHFLGGADFLGVQFAKLVRFRHARFVARTLFSSQQTHGAAVQIFSGVEVDFSDVKIDPLDAVAFRDADLSECRFLGTDLRKAEFTKVKWARIVNGFGIRRVGVYDEVLLLETKERGSWFQIEQLYRQLKQNYEDRKDYERAGDFHYGEKEMRRINPKTGWGLWIFLTLYCWVSGYGERYLRPLLWAVGLLLLSTAGYVWWGLSLAKGAASVLHWPNGWDWLRAGFYSLRVMFLLKPDDFFPVGYAKLVHTGETLLGPLLIGLFALALRQRLKR